jgi:hypothetical protein
MTFVGCHLLHSRLDPDIDIRIHSNTAHSKAHEGAKVCDEFPGLLVLVLLRRFLAGIVRAGVDSIRCDVMRCDVRGAVRSCADQLATFGSLAHVLVPTAQTCQ